MENKQTTKSYEIMNNENLTRGIYYLATTFGLLIIFSPLCLLMHDGGNGPDIYNFIGLAYLAALVLLPKIIKWWRNK